MTIYDMRELRRLLKLYIEEFGSKDADYATALRMIAALDEMLGGE